jgi:hypothetical protein
MILLLVAAVGSYNASVGCRTMGPTVQCELAPPIPAMAYASRKPERPQVVPIVQAKPRTRTLDRVVAHRSAQPTNPNAEEIDRHIAALVAIEDCTGARYFANSVGAADLAQRTYDACIGTKPMPTEPVLKPSADSNILADAGQSL